MEICDQHRLMMEQLLEHQEFVGKTDAKLTNLCKICDNLTVIAKTNQSNIIEIKECIEMSRTVSQDRYDERKRSEERVPGFAGSLNRAFDRIRDNFAFYLLVGGAGIVLWFFVQLVAVKMGWRQYF